MKTTLIVLFFAFSASAFAQVEVTSTGIQGIQGSRYAVFTFKNATKNALKNVVIAFNVKLKLAKNGKQWESDNTEMAEVKYLKAGQSYQHTQPLNDAVIQVISCSLSSVVQR